MSRGLPCSRREPNQCICGRAQRRRAQVSPSTVVQARLHACMATRALLQTYRAQLVHASSATNPDHLKQGQHELTWYALMRRSRVCLACRQPRRLKPTTACRGAPPAQPVGCTVAAVYDMPQQAARRHEPPCFGTSQRAPAQRVSFLQCIQLSVHNNAPAVSCSPSGPKRRCSTRSMAYER